jgi:alpha-L-rhamnosidase
MDQRDTDDVVPIIIPTIPMPPNYREKRPMAIWGDCAIITPWDLYTSFGDKATLEVQWESTFGDKATLEVQWESMCLWLDKGVPRDER